MKTPRCSFLLALALSAGFAVPVFAQSRANSDGTRAQSSESNSGAGAKAALHTGGVPDGIARLRGHLFYVKEGRGTQITGAQRFTEGITAQRNGSVLLADGRLVKLTEGQMVTMAGELRDAPRNIELPRLVDGTAGSAPAASAPRTTD